MSPCVLPLIPGYISYVSGSTLNELLEKRNINLLPIVLFTLGFSIVFIFFGATATFLGKVLLNNSYELRILAGLIIVIFSLHILGIFNIKFLNYEKRIQLKKREGILSPIIIGMLLDLDGLLYQSILGSILILASTTENISKGIILLFFYSLGLAIPFILSGYLIQKFLLI